MATEEDLEKEQTEEGAEPSEDTSADEAAAEAQESAADASDDASDERDAPAEDESDEEAEARDKAERAVERRARDTDDEGAVGPQQLGAQRFVYGAYFAGAIGVAFFASKAVDSIWTRLAMWKPGFGEPHDEYVMPIAGLIGVATALYYWKRTRARQLAEEVASELSKVTWPTKQEVTNNTAVVLVTTAFAVVFFALMDRFWGFVTNLVYGS